MYQPFQSEQQRMEQPPAFISTKDLAYLTDALSWELLAMKKCSHFARESNNEEIKQMIDQAGMIHRKHCGVLLRYLDPNRAYSSS